MSEKYLLRSIESPDDVKKLPESSLDELTRELREVIIETCAENGGHLASNLGMVEPTVAIHRVFDCGGGDRIIFDVGHQAYAHKLLTGRYTNFGTLRQFGGISGLTNKDESLYDTVTAGHSGTSLSTAVGLAEANRINAKNGCVVAVIGDGSFTNGMIYEALNQIAGKKLRLVIVLNDNEMSISKNVGGLSKYLSYIRTSEGYFNFKTILKKIFEKIPLFGGAFISAARKTRDFFKRITNSETWFESFGLEYIGPVNGNDLGRFTAVLEEAKQKSAPVIVHMKTKKGLGYPPAERYPEKYHSTGQFEIEGKSQKMSDAQPELSPKPDRTYTEAFSDILCKYAAKDEKICAVTAAMTEGCGLANFRDLYPDRFFDVGIAEEHAVTMSGGLSLGGMKPVAVIYSTFSQRTFDQLWHDVALQRLPLVLVLSHCGIVPGDGVTHQGIFDVSLFSALPEVKIYSPYDEHSLERVFSSSIKGQNINIIRYPKDVLRPLAGEWVECGDFILRDFGEAPRLTVLTYGRMTAELEKLLGGMAVSVRLISLIRIFPLPEELFARLTRDILFIEENYIVGGIAQRLSSELNLRGIENRMQIKALETTEIPHGSLAPLLKLTGFDAESLKNLIHEALDAIK